MSSGTVRSRARAQPEQTSQRSARTHEAALATQALPEASETTSAPGVLDQEGPTFHRRSSHLYRPYTASSSLLNSRSAPSNSDSTVAQDVSTTPQSLEDAVRPKLSERDSIFATNYSQSDAPSLTASPQPTALRPTFTPARKQSSTLR